MFIRKRISKNKYSKEGFSESYQLIETYREEGKVKQRVICNLGRDATPEAALERARYWLKWYEDGLSNPLKAGYNKGRFISKKRAEKHQESLEKSYAKAKEKVEKLESVVSQMCRRSDISDTTNPPPVKA
jgi:hypothetical protein